MKVSSSCQWSHSSSWVRMLRMVRMVRMVDQSLLLLFFPLLSSAGPFHPFLHGLFGFRDSDAGSASTFTSMPITAPAAIELCPRKPIDYRVGKVTAYTGSSGGHCGFTRLPQGVGDKYWPSAILAGWRVTSVAPVFASSILMGRWDYFQKRQEITFHLCAVSLVFSSYISPYLSYLYINRQ